VRVERMVAEGDIVVVEWTLFGTHRGRLMGIPATGKPVSFKGISMLRYRKNMVMADTRVWDLAGLLRQIGLLPAQE
jgi:predicted ester cyclase